MLHLKVDNGHVKVAGLGQSGVHSPLRAPNPYNGPLRAGVD
jgi:hypothetical protein